MTTKLCSRNFGIYTHAQLKIISNKCPHLNKYSINSCLNYSILFILFFVNFKWMMINLFENSVCYKQKSFEFFTETLSSCEYTRYAYTKLANVEENSYIVIYDNDTTILKIFFYMDNCKYFFYY